MGLVIRAVAPGTDGLGYHVALDLVSGHSANIRVQEVSVLR